MAHQQSVLASGVETAAAVGLDHEALAGVITVPAESLDGYRSVVSRLGGNADTLIQKFHIDGDVLNNPNGLIPYRSMVRLLEQTAKELNCSDFGMQLAAARQQANQGPVGIAMRNSENVGKALQFLVKHVHAYSRAVDLSLVRLSPGDRLCLRFQISLSRLPYQRHTVENSLLLLSKFTESHVRPKEVWFAHEAQAPVSVYRTNFGVPVRFDQPMNGLVFGLKDMTVPISHADRQVYALAADFIKDRFPVMEKTLTTKVRLVIQSLLQEGSCTQEEVADKLAIHPRTLQRWLKTEGSQFDELRDEVRREAALRFLAQPSIPFTRVAAALGYSEGSTFSRNCRRWFAASPRQVRQQLAFANGVDISVLN